MIKIFAKSIALVILLLVLAHAGRLQKFGA